MEDLKRLLTEIRELEHEALTRLKKKEDALFAEIRDRRVELAPISFLAVAPVIYSMIFPALLMDAMTSFYQAVCFPVFRIPQVRRSDYIALDRHRLDYLSPVERFNCDYCGYFNGVIAFTREVASRTEQYFCPIKHARKKSGEHRRLAGFADYGNGDTYPERLAQLRKKLNSEGGNL